MHMNYAIASPRAEGLEIVASAEILSRHELINPCVWRHGETVHLMVCAVPRHVGPTDPTGEIYTATSADGRTFSLEPMPAITPGLHAADLGGVEDPTVLPGADGRFMTFYTGVDAGRVERSLLVAEGSDLSRLSKRPVALSAPPTQQYIRRATVTQGADGRWRMFYEYMQDRAARIGLALADELDGPWKAVAAPIAARPGSWDNWHLSTGPIVARPGEPPVMYYNGAGPDAKWRIGWIAFDEAFGKVVARCEQPLLEPCAADQGNAADVAFAASCLTDGDKIWLYYSSEDRVLNRVAVTGIAA